MAGRVPAIVLSTGIASTLVIFWCSSLYMAEAGSPRASQDNSLKTLLRFTFKQLQWKTNVFVTDNRYDNLIPAWTEELDKQSIQQIRISGPAAVSGDWVEQVITTGEESWRPVNIIMLCSLPCMLTALTKASDLQRQYRTQTAFSISSRWLLIENGRQDLSELEYLNIHNITMSNVALLRSTPQQKENCKKTLYSEVPVEISSLLWTETGRRWVAVDPLSPWGNRAKKDVHNMRENINSDNSAELSIYPNLRRGMNGQKLHVLAKEWLNFVKADMRHGHKVWSGLLVDVLQFASRRLNFTFEIQEAVGEGWGTGANANEGFFGHVVRKETDLGLAPATVLAERWPWMDFTYPVSFSSTVMVYRKQRTSRDFRLPLGPLTTTVWLTIIGVLIISTLIVYVMEDTGKKFQSEAEKGTRRKSRWIKLKTLGDVFQVTGAALLAEGSEVRLRSRPSKVLLSSWWMFSILIGAIYSGTLTAFLSAPRNTRLFNSLEDLVSKQHEYSWGTFGDGASLLLFQSNNSVYRKVLDGIRRFSARDPDVISNDVKTVVRKVRTENFVLFDTSIFAATVFGEDCDVEIVDAGVRQEMQGLPLPKNSSLTRLLSDVIQMLHSNGLLSKWSDEWFPLASCPGTSELKVITLSHVQGVLLVTPVGAGLAFVVLGAEKLYKASTLRKKTYNL